VDNLREAQKLVPSVRFQAEGNNTQVIVRGVGSVLDFQNVEPNVAFNFAGIYVPREATTDFVVERALPRSSLLRVRLRTGRTHQIRVHLEAIGHPVVGDTVYAGRSPGETYGLERQFLHAARLAFDHPVTGARVDVRSPLPEDLAAALAQAERRGGPSTATPRSG